MKLYNKLTRWPLKEMFRTGVIEKHTTLGESMDLQSKILLGLTFLIILVACGESERSSSHRSTAGEFGATLGDIGPTSAGGGRRKPNPEMIAKLKAKTAEKCGDEVSTFCPGKDIGSGLILCLKKSVESLSEG